MKKNLFMVLSCIFALLLVVTGLDWDKTYAELINEDKAALGASRIESSEEVLTLAGITMKGGCIASLTFPEKLTGTVYVAVYEESGRITGVEIAQIDDSSNLSLDGTLAYNTETESIRCFLTDSSMQPKSLPYVYAAGTYTEGDGIIHLEGTSIDASGVEGVDVSGTTATINAAGEYQIQGTLDDGQIVVKTSDKSEKVTLKLTNVNVSSSAGNALDGKCGKLTIENTEGSTSSFTSTYSSEDEAGCGIYSKNDLTIKGDAANTTLAAVSASGNAIRCKADLEIGQGDLDVTGGNNGIKGDEGIKITKKAGKITVDAVGDAMKTDAIDSDTLALEYEKGNIVINGGTITLKAEGDGIQADDTVTIEKGTIDINAGGDGIKANTANTLTYDEDSTASNVEGKVEITGGTLNITAREDGIKAAGAINISGGNLTVISELDGIQSGVDYTDTSGETCYSSGNLSISGGTVDITAGGGNAAKRSDEDSHKGIKACGSLEINGGTFEIDSYDDAIHSNYLAAVTGGAFEIASGDDGIHADYKLILGTEGGTDEDYSINISTSYEGLEGSVIEYLSGTTYLYSTDDGVNAAGDYTEAGVLNTSSQSQSETRQMGGSSRGRPGGPEGRDPGADDSSDCGILYIKGGRLYVVAKGDGLDSNGDIAMTGGIVLVNGTTSGGNGVFDKGDHNNVFTVTGGTLVGFGTTDMQDNPTSVSNGYYSNTNIKLTKGTPFSVSTDRGSLIINPEITMDRALLYVTCENMTKGKTYSVTSGASTTGAAELLTKTAGNIVYGLFEKVSE